MGEHVAEGLAVGLRQGHQVAGGAQPRRGPRPAQLLVPTRVGRRGTQLAHHVDRLVTEPELLRRQHVLHQKEARQVLQQRPIFSKQNLRSLREAGAAA